MNFFLFIFIFTFFRTDLLAQDSWMCELLLRSTKHGCSDYARSNSVAASFPQIFDAFNVNPAAIPTKLTPVGVEIYHGSKRTNVSMIKGLEALGVGFSSSETDANFFSNMNNLEVILKNSGIDPYATTTSVQNAKSTEQSAYSPSKQFGFAFPLLGKKTYPIAPILGMSIKSNNANNGYKYNTGLSINTKIIHFGATFIKDSFGERAMNANFGFRIFNMLLDYTYFSNYSSVYSPPDHTQIFSASYTFWGLDFNLAYRSQSSNGVTNSDIEYLRTNQIIYRDNHVFAGIQYKWNERISLGVFHNYILNTGQSMVLRIFF